MRTNLDTRNYCLILYNEGEDLKVKEKIIKNYDYAYCLHDKDIIPETGELKKAHHHFILKFNNTRSISAVSDELGLPSNHLEYCRNLKGAVRYLIHMDDPDKYQYPAEDIKSSFVVSNHISSSLPEDVQAQAICDYILSAPTDIKQLTCWCLANGYYSAFRRGIAIWSQLLR